MPNSQIQMSWYNRFSCSTMHTQVRNVIFGSFGNFKIIYMWASSWNVNIFKSQIFPFWDSTLTFVCPPVCAQVSEQSSCLKNDERSSVGTSAEDCSQPTEIRAARKMTFVDLFRSKRLFMNASIMWIAWYFFLYS